MSNAVHNLGSHRGVDGATRGLGGAGAPNAGDGEFATVMNLAIGGALGMRGADRDGGDPDGAPTGGAGRHQGEGIAASSGTEPGAAPAALPSPAGIAGPATDARPRSGQTASGDNAPGDGATITRGAAAPSPADLGPVTPPHRGDRHRPAETEEAGQGIAPMAAPTLAGNSSAANPGDGPAPPRHRGAPGTRTDQVMAAALGAAPSAVPNDASALVAPLAVTGTADSSAPPPATAVIVAAVPTHNPLPSMPTAVPSTAGPRIAMPDRPGAVASSGKSNGVPGAAVAPDAAPPNDPGGDAVDAVAGIPPAIHGHAASGDAAISADPPTVAAALAPVAGQNGDSGQPADSSPDPGGNPASAGVDAHDRRATGNDPAPGQNPPSAARPPTIADATAPGASSPVSFDPRIRPTDDNSALVGASSAASGTMPADPIAAPATAPADTGAPSGMPPAFGDALANHVMSMVSGGHQETTLQLQPPQLGDLTVRVAVQGRDVSAWFGAAQPQVQQAVGQALDQLRLDLAGAGFNLTGAWVGADASGGQRPFEAATLPARRAGFATAAGAEPANDADPPPRASGVSVYV